MKNQYKELRARVENELRARFPESFNFTRKDAAHIIGVVPGYLANCELAGRPLVEPVRIGRKPVYPMNRVVDFLVDQQSASLKPKRGRPAKTGSTWDGRLRRPHDEP